MRNEFENYLTTSELAFMIGTRTRVIERLVTLELIKPARRKPTTCFTPEILPRVRHLMRLHDHLGISWTSMGLVLELMDRIRYLESRSSIDND